MDRSSLEDLKDFDTPHLTRLKKMMYDRWTWETGSDSDKEFLRAVETELENRKAAQQADYDLRVALDERGSLVINDQYLLVGGHSNVGLGTDFKRLIAEYLKQEFRSPSFSYQPESFKEELEGFIKRTLQTSTYEIVRELEHDSLFKEIVERIIQEHEWKKENT